MEYASGGELYKYVEEKGRLNEIEARKIFMQIVNAMSYCHTRGIVHRDLKLENVLFKNKGDLLIKVVDFGIAGVCAGSRKDKVDAGSIAYMPPEVIHYPFFVIRHYQNFKSGSETSPAIDVWAIGAMLYATLYGHLPFWGDTEDEFIDRIINAPLKFDANVAVTDLCKDVMRGMLQKDPEKRLPLLDVMNHQYFMMDEEDLEEEIKKAEKNLEIQK